MHSGFQEQVVRSCGISLRFSSFGHCWTPSIISTGVLPASKEEVAWFHIHTDCPKGYSLEINFSQLEASGHGGEAHTKMCLQTVLQTELSVGGTC